MPTAAEILAGQPPGKQVQVGFERGIVPLLPDIPILRFLQPRHGRLHQDGPDGPIEVDVDLPVLGLIFSIPLTDLDTNLTLMGLG